jgi:hypothetical protein
VLVASDHHIRVLAEMSGLVATIRKHLPGPNPRQDLSLLNGFVQGVPVIRVARKPLAHAPNTPCCCRGDAVRVNVLPASTVIAFLWTTQRYMPNNGFKLPIKHLPVDCIAQFHQRMTRVNRVLQAATKHIVLRVVFGLLK